MDEERQRKVSNLLSGGIAEFTQAKIEADPVAQRRAQARAAAQLREAADVLDDNGRLTE